ncbi:DNA-binding protein HEXBP [Fulvia fulva]|uniref:DNA-binding protein HEXBP n=1 Tax=Passalora fulva TaxID=5499 RepID=A0A9Q8PH84_PASFU|nr:DNA-binding protein HEXBP [Fulvia fulva]KAK4626220.1 DNA-binding protein HEXBP [Fulvia fulva]KAK4627796.1 DNA-binding protein HEXBP [Fulvia fulva]UJO22604.1 DNA-binding protein HEXBP [Fulvia fulva]WPV14066.1 DNA-binding protein HEXBP [Fulvia fulva]WPV28639.1 DNA-binding protein HEXBP [Fulvia fulva]
MSWDDTPAPAGDNWQADGGSGGFQADGDAGFGGGDIEDGNLSMHHGGGSGDGGCRNCGEDGHFARDCPEEPRGGGNSGEGYNCGETGHNKAECTNERVEREFTGTCRVCEQVGHRAAECPEKPPTVCKLCKGEGHIATECTINRATSMFQALGIQDMPAEEAWAALEAADKEKEIEDIKKAIYSYAKAFPELTFEELENTFRDAGMNTYLIAKEQPVSDMHTIVNLQGKQELRYVVSFQWSDKPRRAKFAEGWPESKEDNLTRLAEAGFVMDGLKMKCTNCNELGHWSKSCEQEKNEAAKVAISCANCNEEGHRARDCTQERKSGKKGCRNCGLEDHIAKDCTEPRSAEGVECKNCNEIGHFSRDCPSREPDVCRNCGEEGHRAKECEKERVVTCRNCDQQGHISKECPEPRNMAKVQCRNCDEFGHTGRECPKPTDWSRVECSNCHEKGHSYKRCTKPAAEEEEAGDGGGWQNGAGASSDGGGGGWEDNTAAPAQSSGGGW